MAKLTREADHYEALGRRVEALLASEEHPRGLEEWIGSAGGAYAAASAWCWLRRELGVDCQTTTWFAPGGSAADEYPQGTFATGGAVGEDDGR